MLNTRSCWPYPATKATTDLVPFRPTISPILIQGCPSKYATTTSNASPSSTTTPTIRKAQTNPLPIQNIQRHYLRLLRLWPIDHLRGVTFHDAIRKRLEARFLRPSNPPLKSNENSVAAAAEPVETKVDAGKESEQLNVLYSLMENRYSRKVCLCSSRKSTCVLMGSER